MTLNPSIEQLRAKFASAIGRGAESCGDSIVYVQPEKSLEVLRWLKETSGQAYNYLADITAVEYRDPEKPLEVVYELFSLTRKSQLRVKIALDVTKPMAVDSVVSVWRGADWLEREVYDMFGVTFKGHPDLRRILMWETYAEGHPLRKNFPLRGRFSRSEQVRQALNANPEAHYSMEELDIAEEFHNLPQEVKERLAHGQRGVIPDPPGAHNG